jgi:hypothetical protein
MFNSIASFIYRVNVKAKKLIYSFLYFKHLPKITLWTNWDEIDNYFGQLSADPFFKNFRKNNLLIETMDYQKLDAKDYSKSLKAAGILEPKIGSPIKPMFLRNSLNSGHQYRHLINWSHHTNSNIESMQRIVEFGGGYGCMRWLINEHKFSGQYEIIDNNGMQSLQKKYLKESIKNENFEKTKWNLKLNGLDPVLSTDDLFIAMWSVSETPTEMLIETLDILEKSSCRLLLAFQHDFNGRNNSELFDQYFKGSIRKKIIYSSNDLRSTYIFR